jgi:hypothetical protein
LGQSGHAAFLTQSGHDLAFQETIKRISRVNQALGNVFCHLLWHRVG